MARQSSLALVAWTGLSLPAMAQDGPDSLAPTAGAWRFSYEEIKLPGQEKMGWVGGNLLFDVAGPLRLGVASYGALRGQRGGFITLGAAGEVRQRLNERWSTHAGLYIGAGGGRDGLSLAGGGLMLRGDVGISYQTAHGVLGLGLSHVRFPSGTIRSTQPYLHYEYPFYSLVAPYDAPATNASGNSSTSHWNTRSQEWSLVATRAHIPAHVVQVDGRPQHASLQLMGLEWLQYLSPNWFTKIEAQGAVSGQSNGYMQILAGGGYRLPVSERTALKLHAALGPAGGGNVDTGGGLLLDAGLSLQHRIGRQTAVELTLSKTRAPSASFQSRSLGIKLSRLLDVPAATSGQTVPWSELQGFDTTPLRIRAAHQSYHGADPQWRNRNADSAVHNLGIQLDYFVTDHWFLTGQGFAAYAGKAGAYMTGQVGAGVHWPLSERWFAELEGLVGAAGGGGLAVGGGLVGQANLSLGYQFSPALSVLASVGHAAAANGPFRAHVAGVGLVYRFKGLSR